MSNTELIADLKEIAANPEQRGDARRAARRAFIALDAVERDTDWEYGKALRGKTDNPALSPSREDAERETDEWNHRIRPRLKKQGAGDPGEGIVVRRVKAGPWTEVQP